MTTEPAPSPQDLAAEGLAALERGDFAAAAAAIGQGLWLAPEHRTLLTLCDQLRRAVPDPDTLVPLRAGMPAQQGALRARYLAARGELTEALAILTQIAAVDPHVRYLAWAPAWLAPDGAAGRVEVGRLLATIADVQPRLEGQAGQWGLIAEVLGALRAAWPDHPHLPAVHALALRDAGRHDEAVAVARAAYEAAPGFAAAVALAGAYRGTGQIEEALRAYRLAEGFAPDDPGPALERGDLLEGAGRLSEALAEYDAVLAREPAPPRAAAGAAYARHRLGEREARYRLWEVWIAHPDDGRARQLARRIAPFVDYLPEPWEALARYARDMTPQHLEDLRQQALAAVPEGTEVRQVHHRLHLDRPEPPSAQLVARQRAAAGGVLLSFDVEQVPAPDPRQPRAEDLRWTLWRFEGDSAWPALSLPEDAEPLAQAIQQIAARQDTSLDYAARAGQWLGEHLDEDAIESLLALMVNPPASPDEVPPWLWLPRVQRICAAAVAFLGEGWEGSARRDALRSLILGPSDWTVVAGAWAGVALAEADGTGAVETATWILERMRAEPIDAFSGPTYGLAMALMFHPATSAYLRSTMLELIREAELYLIPEAEAAPASDPPASAPPAPEDAAAKAR